jgi:ParB family transcriptional regulator, chromosome partitioning protein
VANRARLTVNDAKVALSALDRLVGGEDASSIPIEEIPLERVRPNPGQPRDRDSSAFSDESLQELATSIAAYGVLQPIIVKREGRHYTIVAGERRYRACQMLEMATVPVRVVEPANDEEEMEISLVENLQRKDLDPLEEAQIFRRMLDDLGYTYRSLSERIGKSVGFIDMRVKLLAYDDVREAVQRKYIGVVEARELAKIENSRVRGELLDRLRSGDLDRDRLKEAIKDATRETRPASRKAKDPAAKSPDSDLSSALRRCLMTVDKYEDFDEFSTEFPQLAKLVEMLVSRVEEMQTSADEPVSTVPARREEATPVVRFRAGKTAEKSVPKDAGDDHRQKAIDFVKSYRDHGNLSILDSISRYWMVLERRGYQFKMGDWSAEREGAGRWRVMLDVSVDGQDYEAEWSYEEASSIVDAANDPARTLAQKV